MVNLKLWLDPQQMQTRSWPRAPSVRFGRAGGAKRWWISWMPGRLVSSSSKDLFHPVEPRVSLREPSLESFSVIQGSAKPAATPVNPGKEMNGRPPAGNVCPRPHFANPETAPVVRRREDVRGRGEFS